jgi:hypothetical protein
VTTLEDVAKQVPSLAALGSTDEVIRLLRPPRMVWAPQRGDTISRALSSVLVTILLKNNIHPERLLSPLEKEPVFLKVRQAEPSPVALSQDLSSSEEEEEEAPDDLPALSRDQGDGDLLVQKGYGGLLFVHPCYNKDEFGRLGSLYRTEIQHILFPLLRV